MYMVPKLWVKASFFTQTQNPSQDCTLAKRGGEGVEDFTTSNLTHKVNSHCALVGIGSAKTKQ
jgi:hypothetical protein